MVKRFYITRHGETFVTRGQALNYGVRIFSADILGESREPLGKMGQYLKKVPTDFNASSQFKRCRQTVGIISEQSGKEFVFDKRLNEFFFELPYFFRRRVKHFLNEMDSKGYETVLICTHGAVINELIKAINPQAFKTLVMTPDPKGPPVQVEASRKAAQLENKVSFTKYLSPGVLLTLTENSVSEINFN